MAWSRNRGMSDLTLESVSGEYGAQSLSVRERRVSDFCSDSPGEVIDCESMMYGLFTVPHDMATPARNTLLLQRIEPRIDTQSISSPGILSPFGFHNGSPLPNLLLHPQQHLCLRHQLCQLRKSAVCWGANTLVSSPDRTGVF